MGRPHDTGSCGKRPVAGLVRVLVAVAVDSPRRYTGAMQAGLVSQRLALRDIFTAGGLTRRIFVAVVHVSVTVQPTESDEAELSTRCSPSARRQAA